MTVLRGFCIVGLSAFVCALVGAGVGTTLGVLAPTYYRTVFSSGNAPWFDPVQVGLGLGLTQGLIAGLFVGCAVVLAVAWFNSRRQVVIVDDPREARRPFADATSAAIQPGQPAR